MTTTTAALRIGILGAGPIAQAAHCEAVTKARNATLHALCDVAPDLLARVAAIHQPATTYDAYDAMLADPDIDAIIIATADAFHVPAAQQALAAGKHVLVEKPLGVSTTELRALRDTVQGSGLVLQVGNMKRFDPGIAFARRCIREDIGALVALKAWYCDSVYRYTMTDTLQPVPVRSALTKKPAVDPKADRERYYLLTHGSHLIDTARFLAGDITRVHATLVQRDGMHCWFTAITFADGSAGHLDLTIAVHMDWHEGFQAYGTQGSVIGRTYLPWYRRSSDVECFTARDRQYHRPLGEDADVYRLQVEGFADTVRLGTPQAGANVHDGLATLQVLVAIQESVRTGSWVTVADADGPV